VLDAFSRRVIGWALEEHLRASLAISALEMAIRARNPVPAGASDPARPLNPKRTTDVLRKPDNSKS
jgi:transposase InsO family protein